MTIAICYNPCVHGYGFTFCTPAAQLGWEYQIDGLMQERCNSSVLAMELRLSCINPIRCSMSLWSEDMYVSDVLADFKSLSNMFDFMNIHLGQEIKQNLITIP